MTTRERSQASAAGDVVDQAERKAGISGTEDGAVTYAPDDEVLTAARRVAEQDAELLRRLAR
jgi:hypothetical protein